MKWISGRQNSGYLKKPILISKRFKFDSYILKFPVGSFIKPHRDQVPNARHYRLNIVLKKAKSGGEFVCENLLIDLPRVKLFRPDLEPHSVTKVDGSPRYVLSIGWLRNGLDKHDG